MNPTQTSRSFTTTTGTRLQAFASAFVVTLAMLGGINGLATSDVPAAQLAKASASAQA